jgi:hypothetical protein
MFCPNAKLCVKGVEQFGPKELLGPRRALPHKEIGEERSSRARIN